MTFETHITIDTTVLDPDKRKYLNEIARHFRWKTSNITDDPILGPGDKFYLTRHDTTFTNAHENMVIVWKMLKSEGLNPIRRKIEAVLFDEKVEVR
jgi:hypothetical protein